MARLLSLLLLLIAVVLTACNPPDAALVVPEPDAEASTLETASTAPLIGQPITVSVQLRDGDGNPVRVADRKVTFVGNGELQPASASQSAITVPTNASGKASATFNPSVTGTFWVRAYLGANASGSLIGSASFNVGTSTIVLEDIEVEYDGQPQSAYPTFYPAEKSDGATITYTAGGEELNGPPTAAGEYQVLVSIPGEDGESASASLTILKRTLELADVAWNDKVYDGTDTASGTARLVEENIVDDDEVGVAEKLTGTFGAPSVGSHQISAKIELTGADAGNYMIREEVSWTAEITPRPLDIIGAAVSDKTYDASRDVKFTGELSGVLPADSKSVRVEASFAHSSVGTEIPVEVSLLGEQAGNYSFTPPTLAANIDPRELTVTPHEEQYKLLGNPDPEYSYQVSGLADGDDASLLSGSLSRTEGEDTGLYPFQLGTLSAGKNYDLKLAGDITFAIISVSLESATFTYDGTPQGLAAKFAPEGAQEGATITYEDDSGTVLPGAPSQVGTYTVTATAGSGYTGSATATLVIEPVALSVSNVEFADKEYDAWTGATLSATLVESNLVAGDEVRLADRLVGTFASADIGVHEVVGNIELTGADAANYVIAQQPRGLAEITLRPVTLMNASASSKAYDGTLEADVSGTLSGVRAADSASIGLIARFAQADVGENIAVTVSLTGAEAHNYQLADPSLVASINPRPVTVTVADAADKTYGDALELGTSSTGYTTENLVEGESIDQVSLASDGADAQAPVGSYQLQASEPSGNGFITANYDVTFVPGTLEVVVRPITISGATTLWTYGDEPVEGDLAPEVVSGSLPGFAYLSGILERTDLSAGEAPFGLGTFDIVDATTTSLWDNFAVTYANYSIAARTATLTVTFDGTKEYGTSLVIDGTANFAVSGLAEGESIDSVAFTSPGFVVDAPVGPYQVIASEPTGTHFDVGNYDLTFVAGQLQVEPREVTVTGSFTVAERPYDGTVHAPVADATSLDLVNTLASDEISLDPVAEYSDGPTVGSEKPVVLVAASMLTGADASNYSLSLLGAPTSTGTVLKAAVSFDVTIAGTAGQKTVVYDGGTTFQPNVVSSVEPVPASDPVAFIIDIRYGAPDGPSRGSFRDVGTYVVTVTADDPRYEGVSVIDDIEVLPREIVVSSSNTAKLYGDANPQLLPLIGASSQYSLGSGDAFSAGTELAYAGSADQYLAVGTYDFGLGDVTIVRDGANVTTNYAISFETGFTISARPLTISPVAGQSKIYGDADTGFGFEAAGFARLEDEPLLVGELAREEGESVGTYAYTLGTLDAGANYALEMVAEPATFEITHRPLTLTATTTTVTYGDEGHDLTAQVASGSLRQGDLLTGPLFMPDGEAGTHTFALGDATIGREEADLTANYTISFASYQVDPRSATIVPLVGQSKTYGEADPPLLYDIENWIEGDTLSGEFGRAMGEDVGNYAFTLGTLSNANYTLGLADGSTTFEIVARPLTLGATVDQKEYGDPDPDLSPVLLSATSLRVGDDLIGTLSHEGVDANASYDLAQGSVQVQRDGADVTDNYELSFGTFTIVPKPVTFDITNSDFVISDGGTTAHVFQGDGETAIRGLEVESDPAGMNSFRFSYRRTHDENHNPVPDAQQSVQNINLLGSYIVTVSATDPNFSGVTPINVWVSDVTTVAFKESSESEAVLGQTAEITVELLNAEGVARPAGPVAVPVALTASGTGEVTFRDAADQQDMTGILFAPGVSSVGLRVLAESAGSVTITATPTTEPLSLLGAGTLEFTAVEPVLTASDDGPYDVVAGGTVDLSYSDLLANDSWTGDSSWGFDTIVSSSGVTATEGVNGISVSADPDAGNTTGTITYRIASEGAYGKTATANIAVNVTLSPVEAIVFTAQSEFDAFIGSSYEPPTFQEVFNTWPRVSNGSYFEDPSTATGAAADWTYDSAVDSIVQPTNTTTHEAVISPSADALDYYDFEATLKSDNSDNDSIGLLIAFVRDEGVNKFLVAHRTQGGNAPLSGWGISYFENGSQQVLAEVSVGGTYSGWSGYTSRVKIERRGDLVRTWATPWNDSFNFQGQMTIDLNAGTINGNATGVDLSVFKGKRQYGYYTISQAGATYLDIRLEGGVARDVAILLSGGVDNDTDGSDDNWTGSEVWRFSEGAWAQDLGQTIQLELGYPRDVTSVAPIPAPDGQPDGRKFRVRESEVVLSGSGN